MVSEEWWQKARHEDWWKERDEIYGLTEPDWNSPPGFLRPVCTPPHTCEMMVARFEDDRDMIAYLPWTREYGIRILDPDQPVDHQPIEIKPIRYCPWCGDELPESLRAERVRRLAAMGLTPDSDGIPERLTSDAWWREAGL